MTNDEMKRRLPVGEQLTVEYAPNRQTPPIIRRVILHGDFPDGRWEATVEGVRKIYPGLAEALGPYTEIRDAKGGVLVR